MLPECRLQLEVPGLPCSVAQQDWAKAVSKVPCYHFTPGTSFPTALHTKHQVLLPCYGIPLSDQILVEHTPPHEAHVQV